MNPRPHARYETRETVGLAFVTALQHLPPRPRALLVLRDVLGFSGAEAAGMLDTTETAVKAALQRARATLDEHMPAGDREEAAAPGSRRERELVGEFAAAVERGGIDTIVSLLTDDAWVRMPPLPYEYQGHSAIAAFMRDREIQRGALLRLVPIRANGQPAFGCRTHRRRSPARTRSSCSRSKATASPRSPGSATSASSLISGSHESSPPRPNAAVDMDAIRGLRWWHSGR
jgi:Sigma-70, region 4